MTPSLTPHLEPVPDVLAEGPDDGEGGRVVVVERVEGHAPVELALVVDARRLRTKVVDLVPGMRRINQSISQTARLGCSPTEWVYPLTL